MRLFNSATQSVERFRPEPGRPVTVYVCGITPYDTTHLGHAFTYSAFDVLIRHCETTYGWRLCYAQNVTDIDDDILRRAAQLGTSWRSLGREWTERFTRDMALLQLRPPDRFVGATAVMAPLIARVEALLERQLAYARGGSVYFRVAADPSFGRWSGLGPEQMLAVANERGNRPEDPNKHDPLDFVLWQAAAPGEPAWHSPWGPGRPGWHIECSTLCGELLGTRVDVHGGGADLAFPHHACEEAQSLPLCPKPPWVRFWAHTAMVRKDGAKMAKSLGNLVMVRDLLAQQHPDTVRLYLLRHHYRAGWEWDAAKLEATAAWTRTLHAALAREPGRGAPLDPAGYGPRFTAAMEDDLDTPAALQVLMQLADDILAARQHADVTAAQDVLRAIGGRVLGLWLRPDLDRESVPPWPEPELGAPDIEAYAP